MSEFNNVITGSQLLENWKCRSYTTFGDRSFAVAAPKLWKKLPLSITDSSSSIILGYSYKVLETSFSSTGVRGTSANLRCYQPNSIYYFPHMQASIYGNTIYYQFLRSYFWSRIFGNLYVNHCMLSTVVILYVLNFWSRIFGNTICSQFLVIHLYDDYEMEIYMFS